LNLGGARRVATDTMWAEKVARFLTHPMVSSMLMTFGFLGLLSEMFHPNGLTAAIGASCLALFFLGQYAASLAGWEEIVLLVVGLLALALEIFVVPGFGVAGVVGVICVTLAVALAFVEVDLPSDVAWDLGYLQEALSTAAFRIGISLLVLTGASIFLAKFFPTSSLGSWMVFKMPAGQSGLLGPEAPGGALPVNYAELLGKRGVAHTVLRPAGIATFDGRRIHVVADGEFIDRGSTVVVTAVDGSRVVVKATTDVVASA
jgi:membrane-bound serine protease (ClpP class)